MMFGFVKRDGAAVVIAKRIFETQTGCMLSFNFNKKKETGVFERKIGEYRIIEAVV